MYLLLLNGRFHHFCSSHFPNAADETCNLFGIRKSVWILESHPCTEYGTTQGKDPVLFCGWRQDYWLGCDTQDAETQESCLTVCWVGVSLAISCFLTFLLLSQTTIIFFQWRMTPITLKINCGIVWKYSRWISFTLVRAEHPQPRKEGWSVPALNSALQMSVTCF